MVGYEGEKMSKSTATSCWSRSCVRTVAIPMAIRLALLAHHYRSDWEWFDDEIAQAEQRLATWRDAVSRTSHPRAAKWCRQYVPR